jgi:hypothetical protein
LLASAPFRFQIWRMPGEPTIEKKSYTEAQAKQVVLRALRGKG